MVGRTVVSYGSGESRYVLINEADRCTPVRTLETLEQLAVAIRVTQRSPVDDEARFIKNDLPSIVWLPDDTVPDTFLQCERLDGAALHQLVLLLRAQ